MNTALARAAAIADGYEGEPTAAVLKLYGWSTSDWSAGAVQTPSPVDTATVKAAGDAAIAAAADANTSAGVIAAIEKLATMALAAAGVIPVMLTAVLLLIGGCGSAAPQQIVVTNNTQALLSNYQANTASLVQAMVNGYRLEKRAEVDALADAAIAAETDANGKANAKNLSLIQAKRLAAYIEIDQVCATINGKWLSINQDAANASVGLAALQQSFAASADTSRAYQQASDAAMNLLQAYINGKTPAKPVSPIVTAVQAGK